MKIVERNEARKLRQQGLSINEITERVCVSKASVSFWVRDIILTDLQRKGISQKGRSRDSIEKRRISRLANEQVKTNSVMNLAKKDIKSISKKDLKLMGVVLYWAEGGKTRKGIVRISNSDPAVIKIMMRFFREICNVPEEKLRGCVHVFEHSNVREIEKYWSSVTTIPLAQFYKTSTKQSSASLSKRQTLPNGTFDIYVCDTVLFLKIMGWIERIKELS
jgi:hypothetical protein